MDLKLVGKQALVTASSRGTGAAIARALAREGAEVFVHGARGIDPSGVVEQIRSEGGVARGVEGDLTTDAGADAVGARIRDVAGGVDVLVNNLGQTTAGGWWSTSIDDWLSAYQINTLTAVRMLQRFVPRMRERGWGRVVQIATAGAVSPAKRTPHYYAAKASLANLGLSLAKELAGSGVTVNTISPGLIRTAEVEQYFRHLAAKHGWGSDWDVIEKRGVERLSPNVSGRLARVEEVADVVVFVTSERASFVNGVNLRVDGGTGWASAE